MQLAVFSACDSQDGADGGPFDADSLAGVFLRAGVPHIVASRWKVNSAATRQFMNLFYQALLGGDSVSNSIHQAQTALRSTPAWLIRFTGRLSRHSGQSKSILGKEIRT